MKLEKGGEQNSSGRLLIITYHYIRKSGGPYPGIHPVSDSDLSQQLDMLRQVYHPASVTEVSDFAKGIQPLERDSFFITFDDGLQDHYVKGKEVLNKHGIHGAFFVPTRPQHNKRAPAVHKVHWLRANTEPTRFIELLNTLLPKRWANLQLSEQQRKQATEMHIHDEPEVQTLKFALNFVIPYEVVDDVTTKMLLANGTSEEEFCKMTFMDAQQIHEIEAEGHVVGMHGHEHVPLSSFDKRQLDDDISTNANQLYKMLGHYPKWLSYPYGRPDAIPNDPYGLCSRHNIDAAFTLISGFNEYGQNNATLKRITPNELIKYVEPKNQGSSLQLNNN